MRELLEKGIDTRLIELTTEDILWKTPIPVCYGCSKKRRLKRMVELNDVIVPHVSSIDIKFDGCFPIVCSFKNLLKATICEISLYKNETLEINTYLGTYKKKTL